MFSYQEYHFYRLACIEPSNLLPHTVCIMQQIIEIYEGFTLDRNIIVSHFSRAEVKD